MFVVQQAVTKKFVSFSKLFESLMVQSISSSVLQQRSVSIDRVDKTTSIDLEHYGNIQECCHEHIFSNCIFFEKAIGTRFTSSSIELYVCPHSVMFTLTFAYGQHRVYLLTIVCIKCLAHRSTFHNRFPKMALFR